MLYPMINSALPHSLPPPFLPLPSHPLPQALGRGWLRYCHLVGAASDHTLHPVQCLL